MAIVDGLGTGLGGAWGLRGTVAWGWFALGRVVVTGESHPPVPVLGLTREHFVQIFAFAPGLELTVLEVYAAPPAPSLLCDDNVEEPSLEFSGC